MKTKKITQVKHPEYAANYNTFYKYRLTYEGGKPFVVKYLKKFSLRETNSEFTDRKAITYCPAHAKAAVVDIKNAIFQRMADIVRRDGTSSYMTAITGAEGGVTRQGDTMTSFIGNTILPDLLVMGKVGIYIDNGIIPEDATLLDSVNVTPYVYHYPTEQILSWSYDVEGKLKTLLLKDYDYGENIYGLVDTQETYYRLYQRVSPTEVLFKMFDNKGNPLPAFTETLELSAIPFVIVELEHSLLKDVCDYQIALLNLASSDISFVLKANFPFYVEQYDGRIDALMNTFKKAHDAAVVEEPGTNDNETDEEASIQDDRQNVSVGVTQGRRYPKDMDAPSFIHPSSKPLEASMNKQEELKQDIRLLVNLALSTVKKRDGSAESKKHDERGLEAGLSYIGMMLEKAERQVAEIWAMYEDSDEIASIHYPKKYDLKTDEERRKEAKEIGNIRTTVPSKTFQKDLTKRIAEILMSDTVTAEKLEVYDKEIDEAEVIITDPETIQADHEAGFVSTKFASNLRGYPDGQVEEAKKDHAERLKRINVAQTKGDGKNARGITDEGVDDPADEKKVVDN